MTLTWIAEAINPVAGHMIRYRVTSTGAVTMPGLGVAIYPGDWIGGLGESEPVPECEYEGLPRALGFRGVRCERSPVSHRTLVRWLANPARHCRIWVRTSAAMRALVRVAVDRGNAPCWFAGPIYADRTRPAAPGLAVVYEEQDEEVADLIPQIGTPKVLRIVAVPALGAALADALGQTRLAKWPSEPVTTFSALAQRLGNSAYIVPRLRKVGHLFFEDRAAFLEEAIRTVGGGSA